MMRRLIKPAALFIVAMCLCLPAYGYTGYGSSGGGGTQAKPGMALPDTIFVAADRQFNIWFEELSVVPTTPSLFLFNFSGDVGLVKDRAFRWEPTAASSSVGLLSAVDHGGRTTEAAATTLMAVSSDAGSGVSNVLFVGDSLLDGGVVVAEVDSLFSVDGGGNIIPYGTQSDVVGAGTYFHEGHGGWTWERFSTNYINADPDTNRFWDFGRTDSRLDFQGYSEGYLGGVDLDMAVFSLGGNEAWEARGPMSAADIATVIDQAKAVIDTLTDATYGYPDCDILINLMPISAALPSAWAADYPANGDMVNYWNNLRALFKAYVSTFDGGAYHANVDVCYSGLWVDNVNEYPTTTEAISSRNAATVTVGTNFLHPGTVGRQQMADGIYSHLRAEMWMKTGGCTNEIADSYQFTGAAWGGITTWYTTTAGQADPWGGTDATIFTALPAVIIGVFTINTPKFTLPTNTDVVLSAFVKTSTLGATETSQLRLFNAAIGENSVNVTWAATPTVAIGGSSDAVGIVDRSDLGAGWWQIWLYKDMTGLSGATSDVRFQPSSTSPITGDSMILGGIQLEYGVTVPCGTYVQKP